MSRNPCRNVIVLGLATLVLGVGFATHAVVAVPSQDHLAPTDPPPPDAPAATVLLLADGRVIRGEIQETSDGYLVRTPIGRMPFKRRDVVQTFASIQELYEHKLLNTADRDPDELMKLAHWCITQGLKREALEHLDTILALSPGLKQAEAMRFQIETALQAPIDAVDPGVMRTSVEQAEPAALSSQRLQEIREAARQSPLPLGMPVIPGMPTAQTIKRYKEFKEFVHRGIQQKCAKCHGEESNSAFQLIQARVRRDLDNEHLVRANFDAVLRLVNPREPAQSELLTRSISPHPPDNRPVLTGPNDPVYVMLHYWVRGLQSATAQMPGQDQRRPPLDAAATLAVSPQPGGSGPIPTQGAGGFASDRGQVPPSLTPTPPSTSPMPAQGVLNPAPHSETLPDGRSATLEAIPPGQMLPGTSAVPAGTIPPASEFPTSPLLGGPNPARLQPTRAATPPAQAPNPSPTAPTTTAQPGQPTIHVPGLGEIPVVDTRSMPARPSAPEAVSTGSDKAPAIDKNALQRFMQGRAGAPR